MFLKILNILLAVNLFLSTTGLSVFNHVCKRKGVFTAFYHIPDSCCSKKQKKVKSFDALNPEQRQPITIKKTPCCKDFNSFYKADINSVDTGKSASDSENLTGQLLLLPSWQQDLCLPFINHKILCFDLYENPPPDEDIIVSIQSFLC